MPAGRVGMTQVRVDPLSQATLLKPSYANMHVHDLSNQFISSDCTPIK